MISYAQNFEDVMLWRALGHVENGFYIDLGAQDPLIDSVSLAFHKRGWRGIHVEPAPSYASLLREQRLGDVVLEVAVGDKVELITFFEIQQTGISTADPNIAQQHRERGFAVNEIAVPCIRLSSIFKTCREEDIHWMKIDVEGFEAKVLKSWGKATARPWIVVVESTLPMTQIESHRQWEPMLMSRGYTPVYFDGLNRYYVSKEKPELRQAFYAPPNVFDDFSVNGTASTALHRHLKNQHTVELVEVGKHVEQAEQEIVELKLAISSRDTANSDLEKELQIRLDAHTANVHQIATAHQTEMLALQAEVIRINGLLIAAKDEFDQTLRSAQRDTSNSIQAHQSEISVLQAEVARMTELLIVAKDELTGSLLTAQQEIVKSTQALLAQEREVTMRLLTQEQEFRQLQAASRQDSERQLHAVHLGAEEVRHELLRSHQKEILELKQALLSRESDFSERMLALNKMTVEGNHRMQAEADNRILQQSRMHADELHYLRDEARKLEKSLYGQIESSYKAALELQQQAQVQTSKILAAQAVDFLRSLSDQNAQILLLQNEIGALREVAAISRTNLQAERDASEFHKKELSNAQTELDSIKRASELVSLQLAEEQTFNAGLQETCTLIAREIENLKQSFSWRLTAPLRQIFHFFSPKVYGSDAKSRLRVGTKRSAFETIPISSDDLMPTSNNIIDTTGAHANAHLVGKPLKRWPAKEISYAELASFNGEQFVENCYLQLLNREADAPGKANYLAQLDAGKDKETIIKSMLCSDEGRIVGAQVTGHKVVPFDQFGDAGIVKVEEPAKGRRSRFAEPTKKILYADLASLSGEQFVETCYLWLLNRQPDPSGKADYLRQLERGESKVAIIERIVWSDEGRRVGVRVEGLWARSILNRMEKWPLVRSFVQIQTQDTAQSLRAVENKLHRLIEGLADTDQINLRLMRSETVQVESSPPQSESALALGDLTFVEKNRSSIFLLVDSENSLATEAASALGGIARAFLQQGDPIFFVNWNAESRNFHHVSKRDLERLELNWKIDLSAARNSGSCENQAAIDPSACDQDDWLLVSDVMGITLERPQLLEVDMIMEARRLRMGSAFIFHGAEPLLLKELSGLVSEVHEQYMQALLLADAIMPVSTRATNDLMAFFVQHQKADSVPLIREIRQPLEDCVNIDSKWSTYITGVRQILNEAADRSTSLKSLYYIIDLGSATDEGRLKFLRQLAIALTECGVALIPVIWDKYNQKLSSGSHLCSSQMNNTYPADLWTKWIEPKQVGAPRWLFLSDEISGELLSDVATYAKSNGLRVSAILSEASNNRRAEEGDKPSVERDRLLFEALVSIDKVLVTSEHRFREFSSFLMSWRGKVHSAEHRFKTLIPPIGPFRQQHRLWAVYAKEIAIELATDRLVDTLRPAEVGAAENVYATLINLRRRPKLSVCISTYNRAGWLEVNLRNIFQQIGTARDDLEVLVVDNTSLDHTPDVVKPYLSRSDFRYVRNLKNVGMLGNLSVTAQKAKGEYIWILGDDDLTRPGVIERVLQIIGRYPSIALIYMNYGYTSEANPSNVIDLASFLTNYNMLEPAGPDEFAPVKRLAAKCENFFTAIYSHVYRRDHALKSYCQDTSGRIFSTMLSCVPTAYYVLNYMADEPAYWIGEPSLVVNSNVSWQDYGVMLELEQLPRTWDLAERMGTPSDEVDRRRANRLWLIEMMWKEVFEHDKMGNSTYILASRVFMRLKHLKDIDERIPEFRAVYERARNAAHPAAFMPTDELFSAFRSIQNAPISSSIPVS
jgi:FkbM family methyltransferase